MSVSHLCGAGDRRPRLERLGLLAGAMLVIAAMFCTIVSTASAKEQRGFYMAGEKSGEPPNQPRFEGEIYPTYLDTGVSNFKFTFQPGNVECPTEFTGKLSSASAELSVTPFYYFASCKSTGGTVAIAANGCTNRITLLNQGPPYVGQYAYVCPPGVSFEFRTSSGCNIQIPSQTGLAEISLKNIGEGKNRSVEATFNISKLKHTMVGSPLLCQPGTYENGTISGTTTLNGYNEP